ncbi:MFS transporter [Bacillota bacterium Meth-B3]|nr:MFS transporter [Christensenellaceae bacterium]
MMTDFHRKTVAFLISQGITLFGSSLVQFAIVWYVTLNTSSGAWVSALSICSFVPQFLISFVAGAWADRYPRKTLIILADAAIAAATLALALLFPVLGETSALRIALLVASALRSLGAGIQTPAVNAMIPQLVPEGSLMRFNGINAALQSAVQFAAPAAAGAILSFGSLRNTLFIDIATALVGIGLLACIAIPKQAATEAGPPVRVQIALGMRYAARHRMIGKLLLGYGLFIFLTVPAGFLATLFVSRTYADSYAYMSVVEIVGFLGMAVGGLLVGTWGGFANRARTLVIGMAAFGALAIGMGAIRSFPIYLILMSAYGIALTAVQTATTTIIQEQTEPAMQGRVFGFLGAMYSGFLPVGMAVFGPLSDALPMRALMILSGILLLLLSAAIRLGRET